MIRFIQHISFLESSTANKLPSRTGSGRLAKAFPAPICHRQGAVCGEDLVVDLDELTDVGKGMTEVVEQLPEVRPGLVLGGVGPELERES